MIRPTLEDVQDWLKANVKQYADPMRITLYGFEIDWKTFSGSFRLKLDDVVVAEKFTFSPEASGKPTFYMPMIHSPLGVPASYAAISITEKTNIAIETALRNVIPRLKPLGKCRATQKEITQSTSIAVRIIDYAHLEKTMIEIKCIEYKYKIEA